MYDLEGKPVCPFCGQYNVRVLDYGNSPPSEAHLGKMYFTCVCMTTSCGAIYKYYYSPF